MKSYSDIKTAIAASKGRQQKIIDGLHATKKRLTEQIRNAEEKTAKDLDDERQKERTLMAELQALISSELGQEVTIGSPMKSTKSRTFTTNQNYKRDEIIARIVELRRTGTPFDTIAEKLNTEGYKPLSAVEFRGASVYQLHQHYVKSKAAA